MSTPTIPAGNLFMNATTYTGNGGTNVITNGATGASFQPDFVWLKGRNVAYDHFLADSVRGISNELSSDTTSAESTYSNKLTSLNSNGFTLGSNNTGATINSSGNTFVGWQWKAGGTAVSNTSGTITSQVSANTTSGFSVVTWTGNGTNLAGVTIGHGLGVAPSMIIFRSRSSVSQWWVGHVGLGNMTTNFIQLNNTSAASSTANIWNSTAPTSTVFSTQNGYVGSTLTDTYVAYCWAPIAGYSAFGSYTGNGSTDGPFIYTGFRSRYIFVKRTDSTGGSWHTIDTSRSPYNQVGVALYLDLSAAESADFNSDILSNGLKIRNSQGEINASGGTYIYAAFAENPFKYANAR